MKWSFIAMVVGVMFVASTAVAQQVVQPQVRTVQPQRSYRSYSVRPAQPQRADRRSPAHAGEATWRHADAKAAGHYTGGR
ncbi:MAG: hypothetical protein ACK54F_02235 [Planctomycetia bacterium]|jgi:opacity protein-like surface antigen